MEATKEFRQKWRALRNAIRVPEKNAKNPHFKSSYRSWEDTEKALRDAEIDSHFVTINNDTQAGVEWWVEIEGEEVKVNTCLVQGLRSIHLLIQSHWMQNWQQRNSL